LQARRQKKMGGSAVKKRNFSNPPIKHPSSHTSASIARSYPVGAPGLQVDIIDAQPSGLDRSTELGFVPRKLASERRILLLERHNLLLKLGVVLSTLAQISNAALPGLLRVDARELFAPEQ